MLYECLNLDNTPNPRSELAFSNNTPNPRIVAAKACAQAEERVRTSGIAPGIGVNWRSPAFSMDALKQILMAL